MFVCAWISPPLDARSYYEAWSMYGWNNAGFCNEISHVLVDVTPRDSMGWRSYGPPRFDNGPPCPWEEPIH